MKTKTLNLLLEACRRHLVFDDRNHNKSLGEKWLGIGTEPDYRQAIEGGYMKFVSMPAWRCMGWLHLTPKGVTVINRMICLGITKDDFTDFNFSRFDKLKDWWKW